MLQFIIALPHPEVIFVFLTSIRVPFFLTGLWGASPSFDAGLRAQRGNGLMAGPDPRLWGGMLAIRSTALTYLA